MVKTIKVYDIDKLIRANVFGNGKKYKAHGYNDSLAIIEGPKGIFILDSDGCGYVAQSLQDEMEIEVDEQRNDNSISIIAAGTLYPPINEIIKEAEFKEIEIKDFVRKFGSRIENNFRIALDTLNEIGLNKDEYYQGGR